MQTNLSSDGTSSSMVQTMKPSMVTQMMIALVRPCHHLFQDPTMTILTLKMMNKLMVSIVTIIMKTPFTTIALKAMQLGPFLSTTLSRFYHSTWFLDKSPSQHS